MRPFAFLLLISLFACGKNVQENPDIKAIFHAYHQEKGVFALYDIQSSTFELYNFPTYRDSSFHSFYAAFPLIALMGVESGAINTERTALSGSKDTSNLEAAMQANDSVFFAQVLKDIPPDRVAYFLDSVHFGYYQKNVSAPDYLYGNKITADQLLGFIKKVYAANLPFQDRTYSIVLKTMHTESNTLGGDIHYFSFHKDPHRNILLGWVEVRKRPYFFVLVRQSDLSPTTSPAMLREILEKLNLFVR